MPTSTFVVVHAKARWQIAVTFGVLGASALLRYGPGLDGGVLAALALVLVVLALRMRPSADRDGADERAVEDAPAAAGQWSHQAMPELAAEDRVDVHLMAELLLLQAARLRDPGQSSA